MANSIWSTCFRRQYWRTSRNNGKSASGSGRDGPITGSSCSRGHLGVFFFGIVDDLMSNNYKLGYSLRSYGLIQGDAGTKFDGHRHRNRNRLLLKI